MTTVGFAGDSQGQGTMMALPELAAAAGLVLVDPQTQVGIATITAVNEGLLEGPPVDVMVVMLGGNDTATGSYPQTLARAAAQAKARAPRVIWWGPAHSENPAVSDRHAAAAAVQAQVLPALGIEWHDSAPATRALAHAPDGTHFTRTSYRTWAAATVALVKAGGWGTRLSVFGAAALVSMGFAMAATAWYSPR